LEYTLLIFDLKFLTYSRFVFVSYLIKQRYKQIPHSEKFDLTLSILYFIDQGFLHWGLKTRLWSITERFQSVCFLLRQIWVQWQLYFYIFLLYKNYTVKVHLI